MTAQRCGTCPSGAWMSHQSPCHGWCVSGFRRRTRSAGRADARRSGSRSGARARSRTASGGGGTAGEGTAVDIGAHLVVGGGVARPSAERKTIGCGCTAAVTVNQLRSTHGLWLPHALRPTNEGPHKPPHRAGTVQEDAMYCVNAASPALHGQRGLPCPQSRPHRSLASIGLSWPPQELIRQLGMPRRLIWDNDPASAVLAPRYAGTSGQLPTAAVSGMSPVSRSGLF